MGIRTSAAIRMAAVLSLVSGLCAQEPRFGVGSRLVLVPVTVTDAKGQSVEGLEAGDFQVLDNGQPRKATVDTIDTGVAPIALVVAVQSSGISAAVLEKVHQIGGMIQPLITGERGCAALVSFAGEVTWLQKCTNDSDVLGRAFRQLRPAPYGEEKKACMVDAVQSAVEDLRSRPNVRRVLLLISESRDRGSESTLDAAAVAVQEAGVTVYAATYSAFATAFTSQAPVSTPRRSRPKTARDDWKENARVKGEYVPPPEHSLDFLGGLFELARLGKANTTEVLTTATGGTALSFTRQKALEETIQKLGAELHSQYVVSFVPEAPAPGYHKLEVRVSRPGEFQIRARPGYWSKDEPTR